MKGQVWARVSGGIVVTIHLEGPEIGIVASFTRKCRRNMAVGDRRMLARLLRRVYAPECCPTSAKTRLQKVVDIQHQHRRVLRFVGHRSEEHTSELQSHSFI